MTMGEFLSLGVGFFALAIALFSAWPRLSYVWQTRFTAGKFQTAKKVVLRYRVLRRMRRDPGKLIGHVGFRFAVIFSLALLSLSILVMILSATLMGLRIYVQGPEVLDFLFGGVEVISVERRAASIIGIMAVTSFFITGIYWAGIIAFRSIRTYRDITSIITCRMQTKEKVVTLLSKARKAPAPAALEIDRGNPVPEVLRWERRSLLFFI